MTTPPVSMHQTLRPQFHFTSKRNWLNDPNGLIYYKGTYHLFFQHNPQATEWGNMTWGHAESKDLIHWKQLEDVLHPDALGTMFSGSGVVDWHNTSKLGTAGHPPLVLFYTAAGSTSPESEGKPFTQCLAYSDDGGKTWQKYSLNPIVPCLAPGNRDPKVIWDDKSKQWVMTLYLDADRFAILTSPNLLQWKQTQTLTLQSSDECPDFFPLKTVRSGKEYWIFSAANGHYQAGSFDGTQFQPIQTPHAIDHGPNFYAAQTWSDLPDAESRRIQIAWMRGGNYPGMPFNQQMSFPCSLTLHSTRQGLRLYRWPVSEISKLWQHTVTFSSHSLVPGTSLTAAGAGELWDVSCTVECTENSHFSLLVNGQTIEWENGRLHCMGTVSALPLKNHKVSLRVLADTTSLEVFGNSGCFSWSGCMLPAASAQEIALQCKQGAVHIQKFTVHALRSAWPPDQG